MKRVVCTGFVPQDLDFNHRDPCGSIAVGRTHGDQSKMTTSLGVPRLSSRRHNTARTSIDLEEHDGRHNVQLRKRPAVAALKLESPSSNNITVLLVEALDDEALTPRCSARRHPQLGRPEGHWAREASQGMPWPQPVGDDGHSECPEVRAIQEGDNPGGRHFNRETFERP